jgi:DNA-binding transcriptional regulator GbsR (MarR family)
MTSADLDANTADDDRGDSRRAYAMEKIVRFWGEMASNWGINRTMAQIYALLYLEGAPLHTDDIMQQLDISRGNANMNLRSLVDWNIVRKMRRAGSRKDFYVAEKDLWDATAQIIRERERREIRPVKEQLQSCAGHLVQEGESLDERPEEEQQMYRRLQDLIELVEVFESFSSALLPHVRRQNVPAIKQMMKLAIAMAESGDGE